MSYANYMPTVESASRTDTGLASELRLSVMRLSRRLRGEREPDNPLSVGALSALGVMFREGECTVGQLAAHERVQPPSMTRTVNCLVEDGYAVRRPHDTDGRQVLVDLTEKGREILLADRRRRTAWLAQRLRELTPDERTLLREAAPLIQRLATY
jgi:DNA-binding MarR family transcriptional regulator